MNPMLAQFTNLDPKLGWALVLFLVGALGVWAVITTIQVNRSRAAKEAIDNRDSIPRRITPQPLLVKPAHDPMTKEDCDRMHIPFERKLTDLDRKIELVNTDLQQFKADVLRNGEERKNFIVGRVDEVRRELSAEVNKVHGRVDELQASIADVPAKTIALLANTGALKK